jgi:uncharacterized protein DUF29
MLTMGTSAKDLYEADFYEWALHNAELLRRGKVAEADIAHIAQELDDMGARERRELSNRLKLLMAHLLKWRGQPDQSRSWKVAIANQRDEISDLLEQMPSLQTLAEDLLPKAYHRAVRLALEETGLLRDCFPKSCPFTLEQLLNEGFFPE